MFYLSIGYVELFNSRCMLDPYHQLMDGIERLALAEIDAN